MEAENNRSDAYEGSSTIESVLVENYHRNFTAYLYEAEAKSNASGTLIACVIEGELIDGVFVRVVAALAVCAVLANALVLSALASKRPFGNQDVYLANLLLAELLVYVLYFPLYLYDEWLGCWPLPYWLCLARTVSAR